MTVLFFPLSKIFVEALLISSVMALIEDSIDETPVRNVSKGLCGHVTGRGKLSNLDHRIIESSLLELKALITSHGALNASTLCFVVGRIAEKHLHAISREPSRRLDLRKTEANRTLTEDKEGRSKLPAEPIFPKEAIEDYRNQSVSLLPPLFRAIRIIVTTIISNRTEVCMNHGGVYNTGSGTCIIEVRKVISNSVVSDEVRYIIMLVGNTLSVVALLILLSVYTMFKELRNLPGKNVMCLSVTMLTVHALQLIAVFADEPPALCRVTGVLLHWAYTWSFVWMSIISFDFLKTFVLQLRTPLQSSYQFKRYLIMGTAVPTVVVLVYVILDVSTDRMVGYGQDKYCFIVLFWPTVSFVVLISAALLFNFACVTAVVRAVYKSRKSTKKVLSNVKKKDKQVTKIALMVLRISTLVGLGWIFGIVGSYLSSSALYYIFLVLLEMQGVLVFIAFVCNKRVYSMLKSLYWKTKARRTGNLSGMHRSVTATPPTPVRFRDCRSSTVTTQL